MKNIVILDRCDLLDRSKNKAFFEVTLDDVVNIGVTNLRSSRLVDLVIFCDKNEKGECVSKILKSRYTYTNLPACQVIQAYYESELIKVPVQEVLLRKGIIKDLDEVKRDQDILNF